jgi:hypothetical protein
MGPIGCPETSLTDYHFTLRKIPAERRCHWHRGGNLESRTCGNFLDTSNVQDIWLKTGPGNTAKVMDLHFCILHSRLCVCVCVCVCVCICIYCVHTYTHTHAANRLFEWVLEIPSSRFGRNVKHRKPVCWIPYDVFHTISPLSRFS